MFLWYFAIAVAVFCAGELLHQHVLKPLLGDRIMRKLHRVHRMADALRDAFVERGEHVIRVRMRWWWAPWAYAIVETDMRSVLVPNEALRRIEMVVAARIELEQRHAGEPPPPPFYPCGCSRLKVDAGRCDLYAPGGKPRPEREP